MHSTKALLDTFTLDSLPDLDTVTMGALELFAQTPLPQVDFHQHARPLVVGSGNALVTGRLLFDDVDAVFADESSYLRVLQTHKAIDGAYLISASGGKHAVLIAQELARQQIPVTLLTNTAHSQAGKYVADDREHIFPKNREPYTYNTSTYMGMLLSKTHEDAAKIAAFIKASVEPVLLHTLGRYEAYCLIIPPQFGLAGALLRTKFDELFGPRVKARVFTSEEIKHAKTVVPLETELFISFGKEQTQFGETANRLHIPLPQNAGYAAFMAIGYVTIGALQKQLPPYFKEHIEAYAREASALFGSTINPIVE